MLQLRPSCECCDRDLPPDSSEAMICSFECTFCPTRSTVSVTSAIVTARSMRHGQLETSQCWTKVPL